jgi:RimJ/RimL family protein N-acetyltransferase
MVWWPTFGTRPRFREGKMPVAHTTPSAQDPPVRPPSNHLVGPRVRLDALAAADAEVVAAWHRDAQLLRHLDAEPAVPVTPDMLWDRWLRMRAGQEFPLAVRTLDHLTLVGVVALDEVLWAQRVAWIAMEVSPAHQGQGYGREGLALLLRFAFDEVNLRRLNLTVFDYNRQAIRLYERAGFRREGVFREFLVRDGRPHDMLLYGLLEREWRAQNG